MKNNQFKGSIYILASTLFFASYGIWGNLMGNHFEEFFSAWTRGLIVLLIIVPIGLYYKQFKIIKRKDIKWFLVFSIPASFVFALQYYGYKNLPMGTVTLLFFSSLVISTYINGFLFFKEKITPTKTISFVLGIIGLAILFSFSLNGKLIPAIACILAGYCGGIEVVFTKKISDNYSQLQILGADALMVVIVNLFLYILLGKYAVQITSDTIAWVGQISYALAFIGAFLFVILGYKYLEPSVGGVVGLLEIPFGIIFGILFFSETLTFSIVIGATLILIASALPNIIEYKKVK